MNYVNMPIHSHRICIVDSAYSLFLYLIYSTNSQIRSTHFFVGDGIDPAIRRQLPRMTYLANRHYGKPRVVRIFFKVLLCLRIMILRKVVWKIGKNTEIFASDHPFFAPPVIRKLPYVLISDGPAVFTIFMKFPEFSQLRNVSGIRGLAAKALLGPIAASHHGRNTYCWKVLLEGVENVPYLRKEIMESVDPRMLWSEASIKKKASIMQIFNVDDDSLKMLQNKSIILLTQQFSTDEIISELEQVEIYQDLIKGFPYDQILIKPHPRDKVAYERFFPGIAIFRSPIPMQLLSLFDIKFTDAITVCSTAISCFGNETRKHWAGTKKYAKILKMYGDQNMKDYLIGER